jgi:tRNA(Ile)-lysidine synthase
MPSAAWMTELVTQLLEARDDAQLLVTHPDCHVRRYRERLHLTPKLADLEGTREDQFDQTPGTQFRWNGETEMAFPAYGGVLHFEQVAAGAVSEAGEGSAPDIATLGLDADWLRGQPLLIEFRRGGERLKRAGNRPTRPLKYHFQELNVPAWERGRLPVVHAGKALIFAAGIGMDCTHLGAAGGRIRLRWQAV